MRIEGSDRVLREGDVISIDGTQGIVVDGAVDLVSAELTGDLDTILSWADEIRLDETDGHANHVRVNADNPEDAELALEFGAEAHRSMPHRAHVPGRSQEHHPELYPV